METSRPRVALARVLAGATLLTIAASVWLSIGNPAAEGPGFLVLYGAAMATTAGLGHLLVIRKDHPVGWMLLAVALLQMLLLVCFLYSVQGAPSGEPGVTPAEPGPLPGARVASWATDQLWLFALVLSAFLIPLFFPDGRLPSPRWRHVLRVIVLGTVLAWLPILLEENLYSYPDVPAPLAAFALPGLVKTAMSVLSTLVVPVAIVAAIGSPIVRWRRGDAVERQQLKWLLAAVGLLVVAQVTVNIGSLEGIVADALLALSLLALPGAVAAAILRYGLFEIDRLFRRTVGYVLALGVLAGLFVVPVVALSQFVPAARDSNVVVALVTMAAAVSAGPIHHRIKRSLDRRFNRRGYDTDELVAELRQALGNHIGVNEITSELVTTISRSLEPATISVYVHEPT